MTTLKLSIVLAALAVAGAASAVSLNFQSYGTASLSSGVVTANNPNLTRYTIGSTAGYTFTSLNYTYTPTFTSGSTSGSIVGTGTLAFSNPSSAAGTFTFAFGGSATRSTTDAAANTLLTISFANLSFNLLPASGSALGYAGTGTFSGNTDSTGTQSTTSFVSNFNPTPEPASLAAVGVGALALVRRRRKA